MSIKVYYSSGGHHSSTALRAPRAGLARLATARFMLILLVALLVAGLRAGAAVPERKFNIGYIPEGSDLQNASTLMEELQQFLLGRPEVQKALAVAGYGEVILSPCDGPRDMAQRMTLQEFDLAFATAVVYARLGGTAYEPILQTKRPGDIWAAGRSEAGVHRRGVVFVGPSSPYFTQKSLTIQDKRALLSHAALAVPSSDSAAGYISPRHIIAKDLGLQKTDFLFCGSDTEVVKHVISGLADLGACSEGALAALLPPRGEYYRILFQTEPIPTDPVLLRRGLLPAQSDLGRELNVALKEFFNSSQKAEPDLRVEKASARDYEVLAGYLSEIDEHPSVAPAPENPSPRPVSDLPGKATPALPLLAPATVPPPPTPKPARPPVPAPTVMATPEATATPGPIPTPKTTATPVPRKLRPALPREPDNPLGTNSRPALPEASAPPVPPQSAARPRRSKIPTEVAPEGPRESEPAPALPEAPAAPAKPDAAPSAPSAPVKPTPPSAPQKTPRLRPSLPASLALAQVPASWLAADRRAS